MFLLDFPTFLYSLERVVSINKFNRDGDLLRLQDLVVQIKICHRETEHLVILPRWLIEDGTCWQEQKGQDMLMSVDYAQLMCKSSVTKRLHLNRLESFHRGVCVCVCVGGGGGGVGNLFKKNKKKKVFFFNN